MHLAVCVKQVPDTTEVRIDPVTNTLVREGVPSILNPYDAHAAEAAVEVKERYGGRVTVVCMGPPQATEVIRQCISYGADRGILLSDRAFAGSDTWATSYTIGLALQRIHREDPLDMVLCGKQAIDGDTAQVGPGLARRLSCPQVTYAVGVESVDLEQRRARVLRRLEKGVEVVDTPLPCVLTCVEEMNELRYASLPNMIRAARFTPEVWGKADLNADEQLMGLKGSPTMVNRIFPPPARQRGEIVPGGEDEPAQAAEMLVDRLVALIEG
jgi:electron transfer flavoprotein beta subunit